MNARIVHFNSGVNSFDHRRREGRSRTTSGAARGRAGFPGAILVNDSDNQRVSVFDKDGRFIETWPFPSRGGIVVAADDTVYVSDVNAGIVNIVKNGKRIDSVSADRAHGLGVDVDGSIYVSGASRMTVMKITKAR